MNKTYHKIMMIVLAFFMLIPQHIEAANNQDYGMIIQIDHKDYEFLMQKEMELLEGDQAQLDYSNPTSEMAIFTSSDESIVTVDKDGNVKATKEGTAVITATVGDYEIDCNVTVYHDAPIFIDDEIELAIYEKMILEPTSIQEIDMNYEYESSDEEIVSVDENGEIEALDMGEAIITISNGDVSKEVLVYVDEAYLGVPKMSIVKGETKVIQYNTNSLEKATFEIDDEKIATVSNNGEVTANKAGTANLTVSVGELEKTVEITVKKSVTATVPQKFEVVKGEKKNLEASTISTLPFTYITGDSSIFTIDSEGTISAKEVGKATATVKIGTKKYSCNIVVTDEISLEIPEEFEVVKGEYKPFEYKSNSVKAPIYESSDDQIFSVDEYGTIYGNEEGEGTLKVTIGDVTKECKVNVSKDISLDVPSDVVIVKGEKLKLDIKTNSTLAQVCTTSNKKIVTCTGQGILKGKKVGSAVVTVEVGDQQRDVNVEVVKDVTIDVKESMSMTAGEEKPIEFKTNSTTKPKFTSSNTGVATIDSNGIVKAKKEGTTKIKVKIGKVFKEIELTVKPLKMTLSSINMNLNVNEQKIIEVKTDVKGKITYKSSDDTIVSVDETGVVTGLKSGKATITVTLGDQKKNCTVTVTPAELVMEKPTCNIGQGESGQLAVVGISGLTVTWTSDNPSVATVDENGKVTTYEPGKAVITAKVGLKSTTCVVTVSEPPKPQQQSVVVAPVPQPSQPSSPSTGSNPATQPAATGGDCYTTETGKSYHRINNCGRTNPAKTTKRTIAEAEAMGLSRCKNCW